MTTIGVFLGSVRRGRIGEQVANWVMDAAGERDAEFGLAGGGGADHGDRLPGGDVEVGGAIGSMPVLAEAQIEKKAVAPVMASCMSFLLDEPWKNHHARRNGRTAAKAPGRPSDSVARDG